MTIFDVASDGDVEWREEIDHEAIEALGRGLSDILGPVESARWWMYRHGRAQYLALDIWGETDSVGITLHLCGRTSIDLEPRVDVQFEVVDLSDACHLVDALVAAVARASGAFIELRLGAAMHLRAGNLTAPVAGDRSDSTGFELETVWDAGMLFEVRSDGMVAYNGAVSAARVRSMGAVIHAQIGSLVSAQWRVLPARHANSVATADLIVVLDVQGEHGTCSSSFRIPGLSGTVGTAEKAPVLEDDTPPLSLHDAVDAFYLIPQLVRHVAVNDGCPLPLAFAPGPRSPA